MLPFITAFGQTASEFTHTKDISNYNKKYKYINIFSYSKGVLKYKLTSLSMEKMWSTPQIKSVDQTMSCQQISRTYILYIPCLVPDRSPNTKSTTPPPNTHKHTYKDTQLFNNCCACSQTLTVNVWCVWVFVRHISIQSKLVCMCLRWWVLMLACCLISKQMRLTFTRQITRLLCHCRLRWINKPLGYNLKIYLWFMNHL